MVTVEQQKKKRPNFVETSLQIAMMMMTIKMMMMMMIMRTVMMMMTELMIRIQFRKRLINGKAVYPTQFAPTLDMKRKKKQIDPLNDTDCH